MIVAAAIRSSYSGVICAGKPGVDRHHHLMHRSIDMSSLRSDYEEGFVDENGVYLDRIEAGKHALECGQVKVGEANIRHVFNPELGLFSEDLW